MRFAWVPAHAPDGSPGWPEPHGVLRLHTVGRARRPCRHTRGSGTIGQLQPVISARLRLHRHHRRSSAASIRSASSRPALGTAPDLFSAARPSRPRSGFPTRWRACSRECCCSLSWAATRSSTHRIRLRHLAAQKPETTAKLDAAAKLGRHADGHHRQHPLTIATAATLLLIAAIGELVVECPACSISASRAW